MAGPCNWPVSYEECGACEPLEFFTEAAQATFEEMAVDYLWNWTGRSLGTCPVTIRPCRADCYAESASPTFWGRSPVSGGSPWTPALVGGSWYNLYCGSCGDRCSCMGTTPSLILPGPVATVTEILIDGAVLEGSAYRVDNRTMIVRLDGQRWPICQDMTLPTTEVGTWQVSYTRGIEVPIGGQVAAGLLAYELMKAACNDNTCRLPQRVQSITRQGVTVAVLDSFEDVGQGKTGIWLIDSWVASVTKPRTGASVRSVDVGPKGRRASQTNATFFGATGGAGGVGGQ